MKYISDTRCIIGEGPIWYNSRLYYTDGLSETIHMYDITKDRHFKICGVHAAAVAFDVMGNMLVSTKEGVFRLNEDMALSEIYNTKKYHIMYANDMKVGPDKRLYVGTQSSKRAGVSDAIDGKLYSIDRNGEVRVLLDGLRLSNGMDWSMDEKRFYHTDSDTNIIKEYEFDRKNGSITPTGREIEVGGVDGFTIDNDDNIYAACWGQGHIAVIDTSKMSIIEYIEIPASIPASCAFCGEDMSTLAITTASYDTDISSDTNAGYTFLVKRKVGGRLLYLFGDIK